MEVFVFPTEGPDASQQSQDEVYCYEFANSSTGTDPFQLAEKAETDEQLAAAEMQAAEATGTGAGARGAAAGALVGEIVDDDASEGAKYGAAAGAVRGTSAGQKSALCGRGAG